MTTFLHLFPPFLFPDRQTLTLTLPTHTHALSASRIFTVISLHGHHTINTLLPSFMAHSDSSRWSPFISIHSNHFHHITLTNRINYHFLSFIQYRHCASLSTVIPFRYTPIFVLPRSHSLPYVIPHYPHFLFFPILFINSLSPLLIFTLISFRRFTPHITIFSVSSLILFMSSF